MYKYIFQILLITIVAASFSAVGVAANYTTKKSGYSSQQGDGSTCTKQDKVDIKRFNAKIKRHLKEYDEWNEKSADVRTAKDSEKFSKEGDKVRKFFNSEEYNAMDAVYKRCNVKIQRPGDRKPYWAP